MAAVGNRAGNSKVVCRKGGKIMVLRLTTGYEAKVRQPSPKLVTVGVLLGTLSLVLGLIGCSGESEYIDDYLDDDDGSGWVGYAALGEGPKPSPDLTRFDTLHFHLDGAQLVLSYDWTTDAFTGTVENTTTATLRRVRVEVYLSNGIKLGPTTAVDLAPGQGVAITLAAGSRPFRFWSAYPEVG